MSIVALAPLAAPGGSEHTRTQTQVHTWEHVYIRTRRSFTTTPAWSDSNSISPPATQPPHGAVILKPTFDLLALLPETFKASTPPRVKQKTFQHSTLGLSQPDSHLSCHSGPHTEKYTAATANWVPAVGCPPSCGLCPFSLLTTLLCAHSLPAAHRIQGEPKPLRGSWSKPHIAPNLDTIHSCEKGGSLPVICLPIFKTITVGADVLTSGQSPRRKTHVQSKCYPVCAPLCSVCCRCGF